VCHHLCNNIEARGEGILPIGPLAWAAAEKSPGISPNAMIDRIRQQARYRPEDLDQLAMTYELSAPALNLWLRRACDQADTWLDSVPRGIKAGLIVDKSGTAINPDFSVLKATSWRVHEGQMEVSGRHQLRFRAR